MNAVCYQNINCIIKTKVTGSNSLTYPLYPPRESQLFDNCLFLQLCTFVTLFAVSSTTSPYTCSRTYIYIRIPSVLPPAEHLHILLCVKLFCINWLAPIMAKRKECGFISAVNTSISKRSLTSYQPHPYCCYWLFVNPLKPTGHVMHRQFNIQQLYFLPTLYLCVLYLSENKQRLVPLTA